MATGRTAHVWDGYAEVRALAWRPDGRVLAVGRADGTVSLWDPEGALTTTVVEDAGRIVSVAWSPDGRVLAAGAGDGKVYLCDADGRPLPTLTGPAEAVYGLAWSPDGRVLATGTDDGAVRLWDPAAAFVFREVPGTSGRRATTAWRPDGRVIAVGTADRTIRLWDTTTGRLLRALTGPSAAARALAWSPDGRVLASASGERAVRLWDAATGETLRKLATPGERVQAVAWSPDGKVLAGGADDGEVNLWDPATGEEIRTLSGSGGEVGALAWNPDGRTLAVGQKDGSARLWDTAQGTELRALSPPDSSKWRVALAWNPEGTVLAVGTPFRGVELRDASTGRKVRALTKRWFLNDRAVAWSPDGRRIATNSGAGGVWLWDPDTGRPHAIIDPGRVGHAPAWSPDGRTLASVLDDGSLLLSDPDERQPRWLLTGFPDGGWLAQRADGRLFRGDDGRHVQVRRDAAEPLADLPPPASAVTLEVAPVALVRMEDPGRASASVHVTNRGPGSAFAVAVRAATPPPGFVVSDAHFLARLEPGASVDFPVDLGYVHPDPATAPASFDVSLAFEARASGAPAAAFAIPVHVAAAGVAILRPGVRHDLTGFPTEIEAALHGDGEQPLRGPRVRVEYRDAETDAPLATVSPDTPGDDAPLRVDVPESVRGHGRPVRARFVVDDTRWPTHLWTDTPPLDLGQRWWPHVAAALALLAALVALRVRRRLLADSVVTYVPLASARPWRRKRHRRARRIAGGRGVVWGAEAGRRAGNVRRRGGRRRGRAAGRWCARSGSGSGRR
jgi:WD40 repeat protein